MDTFLNKGNSMKEINYSLVGEKIKTRRMELNLTQEYIANQLDVNPSHISNIERGRAKPSLTILINIANILTCSIDYFIENEYTFDMKKETDLHIDDAIKKKLTYCGNEKKKKLLKIIDLI